MGTNIITIEQMMKDAKHITSIEIASLVGKPHNDVLKAIRKMESAWVQEHQGNFYQKDGVCLGSGTSGKFFPDANSGGSA